MLVSAVLERAREEIYEAGGVARPQWDKQSGSLSDSSTALTVAGRLDDIPPDSLLEWEDDSLEMADVYETVGAAVTHQTRGYLGTTAASHNANTRIWVDPPYSRYVLLNGLKAVIGQLRRYGLYVRTYTEALTLATSAPVELPTGAIDVISVLYQNGTQWFPLEKGSGYRVFYNYTAVNSAPALQFFSGISGADLKVVYKTDFDTDPFAITTDLDTVGVPTELQSSLSLGLAGWILQGRDVPLLESEHIQPDPQNPQQLGSRSAVGNQLWRAFEQGIYTEKVKLHEQHPIQIVQGS